MENKHPLQEPIRYALGEIPDEQMTFAVVVARYQDQWVFCRHKERNSWELPGGHIEAGETPLEAAARELREETGALRFTLTPICVSDYPIWPHLLCRDRRNGCIARFGNC